MSPNSLSRWLGPLALGAAVVAVLFVVASSISGGEESPAPAGSTQERQEARTTGDGTGTTGTGTGTSTSRERRTYRVRPGDTLALISERTGVTVEELQELNPELDPNSLTVGERLKLTE